MYLETIYDVNVIRYITCIVWRPSLADILRKLVDINPKRRRRVRRVGHARRSSVTKKGSTPSTYSNQTPSTSNWIRTSRQTGKVPAACEERILGPSGSESFVNA